MDLLSYGWTIPLVPLLVFAVVLATGRLLPKGVSVGLGIAAQAIVLAFALAAVALTQHGHSVGASMPWITVGGFEATVGFQIDSLTAVMLVVVSFVSLLVQVYSIGYMEHDERFRWYYGAISLFTASMLGVVLADGWLLMYMCWEVMGLSSYLLIGFWFEKPEAAAAAKKAFMVTRFGDVGFALSLVVVWWGSGTFEFEGTRHAIESGAWAGPAVTVAALLMFMGAMGKSAQFPLHVWLPDAMAGPTPGSALIHAATMVAAGVYLVARSYFMFEAGTLALSIVGTVGTITAVMAALIALAQNDIKKVLAYSTVSQLGYMMLALGAGSLVAAMFHLVTHAFFKALLFLGAGSVIHATHTQDLREMGGLWRKMPWTCATWVIGALSLAGIPPLAGFWSKDEILMVAMHSGRVELVIAGVLTAGLTAFYMGRSTLMAFFVKPADPERAAHAHESPMVMTAPLAVLAIMAALAGLFNSPVGGYVFGKYLGHHEAAEPDLILMGIAVGVAAAGIALAWTMYVKRFVEPDVHLRPRAVSVPLTGLFWIDRIYEIAVVRPIMAMAAWSDRADAVVDGVVRAVGAAGLAASRGLDVFDHKVVDGAVNRLGESVVESGWRTRKLQTGNVQTYLWLLAFSVVVLVAVFAR